MVVCQFFQTGRCKFGDSCKNEHPGRITQANRFALLNNGGGGGGSGGGFGGRARAGGVGGGDRYRPGDRKDDKLPYHLDKEVIAADLTVGGPKGEKPQWPLSAYGPGRDAPRQLLEGGIEQSMEEMRVMCYEAQRNNALKDYLNYEANLLGQAQSQAQQILNDLDGAIKYVLEGEQSHPNRIDQVVKPGATQLSSSNGFGPPSTSVNASNGFGAPSQPRGTKSGFDRAGGSTAFGQPSPLASGTTFGQPSAFGQQKPAFGAPAFGAPSQPNAGSGGFGKPSALGGTAFGQTSTFGQAKPAFGAPSQPGSSAFGAPSAMGGPKPAFGQASQPAFGQSGFMQASKPAFGAPSQPGGASPFGAVQQNQSVPQFGGGQQQQTGFGQQRQKASGFGTAASSGPAFGQPSSSANPFAAAGSSSNSGSAFGSVGQTNNNPFAAKPAAPAFGAPSQPTGNMFGKPSQPAGSVFGEPGGITSTASSFAAASPLQNTQASTFGAPSQPSTSMSAFAGPSRQPPTANGLGAQPNSTGPAAGGQPNGTRSTAGIPDVETYTTRVNNTKQLATWKGHAVTYDPVPRPPVPYYHNPETGKSERIWHPDGPPQANKYAEAESEVYLGDLGPLLKEVYDYVRENGDFKDIVPEIPPKREWIRWDL